MGLGTYAQGSGIAAALFFAKAGARVTVTDMKPAETFATALRKLEKYKNITWRTSGKRFYRCGYDHKKSGRTDAFSVSCACREV